MKGKLVTAEKERTDLAKQNTDLRDANSVLTSKLNTATVGLDLERARTKDLTSAKDALQRSKSLMATKNAELLSSLSTTRTELEVAKLELAREKEMNSKNAEVIVKLQTQKAELVEKLSTAETELKVAAVELEKQKELKTAAEKAKQEAKEDASKEVASVRTDQNELLAKILKMQEDAQTRQETLIEKRETRADKASHRVMQFALDFAGRRNKSMPPARAGSAPGGHELVPASPGGYMHPAVPPGGQPPGGQPHVGGPAAPGGHPPGGHPQMPGGHVVVPYGYRW